MVNPILQGSDKGVYPNSVTLWTSSIL